MSEENILDVASQEVTEEQQSSIDNLNVARAAAGGQMTPEELMAAYRAAHTTKVREYKINRNDPCPCGSGKKYKNCCLASGKYEQLVNINAVK